MSIVTTYCNFFIIINGIGIFTAKFLCHSNAFRSDFLYLIPIRVYHLRRLGKCKRFKSRTSGHGIIIGICQHTIS